LAQTFFRKEESSRLEKVRVLSQLENQSSREAEKILFAHSTAPLELKSYRVRLVAPTLQEYKFLADDELTEKLNRLRGLLAHKMSQPNLNQLLNSICDLALEKLTPKKPMISRSLGAPKVKTTRNSASPQTKNSIRADVKREVWTKANNQCENCGSTYALQIDHIQPQSLGGTHDEGNLRLLCRTCNQRAAIEKLGLKKMRGYWERI
jgi:5-methylcytosine-specific restriction endonuclease McrA